MSTCLCTGRNDVTCGESICSIAGPGAPGDRNSCRICWMSGKRRSTLPGEPMTISWAYGVTTVDCRQDTLLPSTLRSLRGAGFDTPRIFMDGGDRIQQPGLAVTWRQPAVGVVGNWILSLSELYQRHPNATYYALFQDDLVAVRNLRAYLERRPCPPKGYMNLYTMADNEPVVQGKNWGWHEGSLCNPGQPWQTGRGAVALAFSNQAVQVLLLSPPLLAKPKAADPKIAGRCIDGGIVNAMNAAGWREYVHHPSLVQHTGKHSSIGNKSHPQALTFPGEDYNALDLLNPSAGLGDKVKQALELVGVTEERVSKWLGMPCNCRERREKLNQLDGWARGVLAGTITRTTRYVESLLGGS